ncbi:MAG: hypothetical protein M9920_11245 [Verrucomicrobiae bacterium]|nr:hypothetical protein [Verrucomicrobiae bacterium]
MKKRSLKIGWLLITVGAFVFTCIKIDADPNRDLDVLLTWLMLVLSFPASLIGVYINAAVGFGASDAISNLPERVQIFMVWFVFWICGFLQWFVVLPFLTRLWRKRKGKEATH